MANTSLGPGSTFSQATFEIDRKEVVFWEDLKKLPRNQWPVTMVMPEPELQGPFGEETLQGVRVGGYEVDLGGPPASPGAIGTWPPHYKNSYAIWQLVLKLNGQAAYIESLELRIAKLEKIVDELAVVSVAAPTWLSDGPLSDE
jgi:hypothetical protein